MPPQAAPAPQLVKELVCGDNISYDRINFGWSKTWADLPWLAIQYDMSRDDVVYNFGEKAAKDLTFTDNSSNRANKDPNKEDAGKGQTCCVFGIWHKDSRTVIYISEGCPDRVLLRVPDPLGLPDFFPLPEQLTMFCHADSLIPVPLYSFYEEQAKELNNISARINKLISVMKARGIYDDQMKQLTELVNKDDGQFVAAKNVAALQQSGGLDKNIWMWPVEKFVSLLQQLYVQREQVKQVIYEITGMADILRGASVASETATAQNIKNQWGTLRLRFAQMKVSVYARNCFRIMAGIAIAKFAESSWAQITQLGIPTTEEKQQAVQTLKRAMASGAQQPQPNDPMFAQFQQLQKTAQGPGWGDVLQELKENLEFGYVIDIETNSTLDADATEDKADIAALITALATFFQSLGPVAQSGAVPPTVIKALLLAVLQRYRFSDTVVEMIQQMPDGPPPGAQQPQEDPKAAAIKAEADAKAQASQMDLQMKQKQLEFDQQELQWKQEEGAVKHQMAMDKMAAQQQEFQEKSRLRQMQMQQQAAMPVPGTMPVGNGLPMGAGSGEGIPQPEGSTPGLGQL